MVNRSAEESHTSWSPLTFTTAKLPPSLPKNRSWLQVLIAKRCAVTSSNKNALGFCNTPLTFVISVQPEIPHFARHFDVHSAEYQNDIKRINNLHFHWEMNINNLKPTLDGAIEPLSKLHFNGFYAVSLSCCVCVRACVRNHKL